MAFFECAHAYAFASLQAPYTSFAGSAVCVACRYNKPDLHSPDDITKFVLGSSVYSQH